MVQALVNQMLIVGIRYDFSSSDPYVKLTLWGNMAGIFLVWPNRIDNSTLSSGSWVSGLSLNNIKR